MSMNSYPRFENETELPGYGNVYPTAVEAEASDFALHGIARRNPEVTDANLPSAEDYRPITGQEEN